MAISTNSIIHYTSTFDILCKILEEGFKIKYCREDLSLNKKGYGSSASHPMVSFCDIPLTETARHFESYGYYGVGLSKEWAISKGINPVIYVESKSSLAESLSRIIQKARTDIDSEFRTDIFRLKSFSKNYSGDIIINGEKINDYKFYNEREWRFVPPKKDIGNNLLSIPTSKYIKDKNKYNDLIEKYRLNFSPNDISYIIVKKTSEISDLIKFLRVNYAEVCTVNELDILFTKICSTEQILSDY